MVPRFCALVEKSNSPIAASAVYGDCKVAAEIVGYADLRLGDNIAALLDRAAEVAPARFKDVRHPENAPGNDIDARSVFVQHEIEHHLLNGFDHLYTSSSLASGIPRRPDKWGQPVARNNVARKHRG